MKPYTKASKKECTQGYEIKNIFLRKNKTIILDNISFTLCDKTALIGPNGSGKTMLLSVIAQLIIPNSGSIIDKKTKEDIIMQELEKYGIGCMIQNAELIQDRPILHEFIRAAKLHNVCPKETEQLLKKYNIPNDKPEHMPHGKKQIALMLLALIGNPSLVLLDEPFSGLDIIGRKQAIEIIKQYKGTVLITSHLLDEIKEICKHAVFIKEGKVIEERSINTIKNMNDYYMKLYK